MPCVEDDIIIVYTMCIDVIKNKMKHYFKIKDKTVIQVRTKYCF